jgi:hypothetical protein
LLTLDFRKGGSGAFSGLPPLPPIFSLPQNTKTGLTVVSQSSLAKRRTFCVRPILCYKRKGTFFFCLFLFVEIDMREIFYPESVAVIGVSDSPDNMGLWIVRNLTEFGFQGILYQVGVKGGVYGGREIDSNPLRVFQEKEGCLGLDVRMILQKI